MKGSSPIGLTVAQASGCSWPGHQLGAGWLAAWNEASGWFAALVTSPVVGLRTVGFGAVASPSPKTPGLVGYFQ